MSSSVPCTLRPPPLHSFPTRRSSDLSAGSISPEPDPHHFGVCAVSFINSKSNARFGGGRRESAYADRGVRPRPDRKSTRLNSSHLVISYAVFCLKKKKPQRVEASVIT